ncbi:MAG TPA: hypothetical protein VJZ76_05550 [Thermoanaerobaculia bacterium]|nr:hypothetical protein [Thermoanaerobaculia bacterium]
MLTVLALILGLGFGRAPNACQVLSARDVAKVQGARPKSTKLKETKNRELQVSQCLFTLPRLSDSVSIDVMRGDTRTFWRKHFPNEHLTSNKPRPEREAHAIHVDGVGDDAVWSGNRLAGALYVLKGDTIVRVSLGGDRPQEQKIEKAKQLAARALRRL